MISELIEYAAVLKDGTRRTEFIRWTETEEFNPSSRPPRFPSRHDAMFHNAKMNHGENLVKIEPKSATPCE